MKNAELLDRYDHIGRSIRKAEETIRNAKLQPELWQLVDQTLGEISCKKALFYFDPPQLSGKKKESTLQTYFSDDRFSAKSIVCKDDVKVFFRNVEEHHPIYVGQRVPYSPLLFRGIEDDQLKNILFEQNHELNVIRHFGPTGFTGYTMFILHRTESQHLNLISGAHFNLFRMIHDKIANLHSSNAKEALNISRRENDVLQLIVKGKTNHEIAQKLNISPHTVTAYVKTLSLKLNSRNRTETAMVAISLGLSKLWT